MRRPTMLARLGRWARYQIVCLRLAPVDARAAVPADTEADRVRPVEPRPLITTTPAWEQMLTRVFGPDRDRWPDHPFRPGDIITINASSGPLLATVHAIWCDPSFTPPRPMVSTLGRGGTVQWHWPADVCEPIEAMR